MATLGDTRGDRRRTRLLWVNLLGTALMIPLYGYLVWLSLNHRPAAAYATSIVIIWSAITLALACFLVSDHRHRRGETDQRVATAVTQTRTLSERRLATLLAGTTDLMLVLDANGRVTYSSSASLHVLGYSQAEIRGRFIDELLIEEAGSRLASAIAGMADGTQVRLDLMAARGDGRHTPVEVTVTSHLAEQIVAGYVVAIRDISHLEQVTAELARQSQHDPLTTLPNRRLFNSQLAQALHAERSGMVGVIVADVDDFKSINTAYGHSIGDSVLVELSGRLHEVIESSDTLARLGGDEFAIILTGRSSVGMTAVAKKVLAAISTPLQVDGRDIHVRMSLGLAEAERNESVDEVVRNAEVALYWAKESGRSTLARYDLEVHHRAIDQLVLRQDLEQAIRSGELKLMYQTIVDLSDDSLRGVEALVRWDHPGRGLISPMEFVPLAEQSGMMVELGTWILRRSCHAAASMQRPDRPLMMSVNISATQLAQPDFVIQLIAALDEAGLDPGLLMLEITETAVLVSLDKVIPRLAALRSLGVHVSVDDFGTGYSSLAYLTRLPLDELKVDKSFVDRLPNDAATASVVRGMLDMSNSLGLITVGEGIESRDQAAWLRDAGCALGQGYLWAKPLEEHQIHDLVDGRTRLLRVTQDRDRPQQAVEAPSTGSLPVPRRPVRS